MMRTEGTNLDHTIVAGNFAQPLELLDIDQPLVAYQAFFHRQEQLCTAGINLRAVTEPAEQLGGLCDALRLFQPKSSEHLILLLLGSSLPPGQTHRSPDRLCD